MGHYKSYNLRKKYLDRPAFYYYFTYDKGFSKAILRPEYGGKMVTPYEWYNPDLENEGLARVPELPRNWAERFRIPADLSLEERNANQFLADNLLI